MAAERERDGKFDVLCQITRAQHFAWREAVVAACPGVDPVEVVIKMWEVTGRQTGEAYLKRIDPARPVAEQFAEGIAWSSRCMGEDAVVEPGADSGEAFVRHHACPWFAWHTRLGLLGEDRPGCDTWFRGAAAVISERLGVKITVETLEALPDGGGSCLRRLRVVSA